MFRTTNPKDCKNATFDALSFFFLVQPDNWILANVDVVAGLVKIVLSFDSFNTSISRLMPHTRMLSLSPSYVQSNGDLFSSKIK